MNYRKVLTLIIIIIFCLAISHADAQCAMCKEVVDSSAKNGSTVAKGLNMGILYLLVVPFLAISTFSIAFRRRWKAAQK